MKYSLATRYSLMLAAATTFIGSCVLLVNLYFLEHYSRQSISSGQNHLTEIMDRQLIRDAELVASSLAATLDVAVYTHDFFAIETQLDRVQAESNIAYIYIYDQEGLIIHDGTPDIAAFGRHASEILPPGIFPILGHATQKNGHYIHVAHPIGGGDITFATLRLAIAYNDAEHDIQSFSTELEAQGKEQRNKVLLASLTVIIFILLIACGMIFVLSHHLLSPIKQLVTLCRHYAQGRKGVNFRLDRADELGLLGDALEDMKDSINASRKEAERQAYQDPLTRLPNRRRFNESLQTLLKWAAQEKQTLAVLFIDLDHFKQVNDVAGHEAGDLLLIEATRRLTEVTASMYIGNNVPLCSNRLLCRLGGDEFVLLVPAFNNRGQLSRTATKITRTLSTSFSIGGQRYNISASIGVTSYPQHGQTLTELLRQADIAMYAAKHSGRGRHRFFEPEMNSAVLNQLQTQQGVRTTMQQDQLALAYQPIVSLQDDSQIVGAEALIRWHHPTQGLQMPDAFIPVIEKTDLIEPLTLWTLEQACQDLRHKILPKHPSFRLSINISGAVLHEPGIRQRIRAIIERYTLPAGCLHLELTETSMVENIDNCADILRDWKNTGAEIWIDDFGTGYSSLSYLHRLPLDGLKVDRSFVSDLERSNSHQVVDTILTLARSLGLETISEGIESAYQQEYLRQRGCNLAQGYLFSRPLFLPGLLSEIQHRQEAESLSPQPE